MTTFNFKGSRRHAIFKEGKKWCLARRSFGFSPHVETLEFDTWRAAMNHAGGKTASHASTERTYTPSRSYIWGGYVREDNFPVRIT